MHRLNEFSVYSLAHKFLMLHCDKMCVCSINENPMVFVEQLSYKKSIFFSMVFYILHNEQVQPYDMHCL